MVTPSIADVPSRPPTATSGTARCSAAAPSARRAQRDEGERSGTRKGTIAGFSPMLLGWAEDDRVPCAYALEKRFQHSNSDSRRHAAHFGSSLPSLLARPRRPERCPLQSSPRRAGRAGGLPRRGRVERARRPGRRDRRSYGALSPRPLRRRRTSDDRYRRLGRNQPAGQRRGVRWAARQNAGIRQRTKKCSSSTRWRARTSATSCRFA